MAHVGHSWLKTKPGSFQKVCDRYKQFASEVLAHNADLHDVIIVGNQAQNIIDTSKRVNILVLVALNGTNGMK